MHYLTDFISVFTGNKKVPKADIFKEDLKL